VVAALGLARQGRRGARNRRRFGEDATPARRRHDRLGQVCRRQRDARQCPFAREPARGPARAGRSEQVELNHYDSIPHLLTPVITNPRMAANALMNLVREMEQRYGIMSLARTRSLVELNRHRAARGERSLPYILCVIDELADLMMVARPMSRTRSSAWRRRRAPWGSTSCSRRSHARRCDHGDDQGERAVADRVRGLVAGRFARDSRPERRRVVARCRRHAVRPIGSSAPQRIQGAFVDEGRSAC